MMLPGSLINCAGQENHNSNGQIFYVNLSQKLSVRINSDNPAVSMAVEDCQFSLQLLVPVPKNMG